MSSDVKRRYGSRANRQWWGTAHRLLLIASGEYVYTSHQRGMGLMQFVSRIDEPYEPFDASAWWHKRMDAHYGPDPHKGQP